MQAFRWLVIGTGRIANTVMKEITKTERHTVTAVYSRTRSRAERFAKRYGAEVFDDVRTALRSGKADCVYIATPHSVHYEYLIACIEEGMPVLCEKSFTVNAEQAEKVLSLAEEKGVYVTEGMWTRFNPVVKRIRSWVESGKIGVVKDVYANFCLPVDVAKPFISTRVYKAKYAGGALLDLGVYPIAYAQMLLGYPNSITCLMRNQNDVDYDDKILLVYDNAVCHLHSSFDGLKTYGSLIRGSDGYIKSNMFYKPTHARLYVGGKHVESVRCKRGYIYQFDAVAEDVREGKIQNEYMPHSDTLAVMRIMDDCRKQGALVYSDTIEKL